MGRILITIIIFFNSLIANGQVVYWQETLHGGSTMAGVTCMGSPGSSPFNISYPDGSIIKKAFFIITSIGRPYPSDLVFDVNDQPYYINSSNTVTDEFICITDNGFIDTIYGGVSILDFTNFVNTSNYIIDIPIQYFTEYGANDGGYSHFYLWVLYENATMPLTTSVLILNKQDVSPIWKYKINYIPPVSNSYPVGITFLGAVFNNLVDGSFLFVNEENFGYCWGHDWNSLETLTSGTSGSYFYENNTLFGLGDDTADDTVSNSDALADVKSAISNGIDSINVTFPYYSVVVDTAINNAKYTNSIWAVTLAYTPYECEVLPVNITSDTVICFGSSVTLTAGGGTDYFWQSSMGSLGVLDSMGSSITVSPTTTTSYTVRIEAEGFCPEVRPVQVVVHKIPEPQITSTTSNCGDAVGNIEVTFPYCFCDEFSVAFNNQTPTLKDTALSPINFSNLATGVYPISITDNIGCSWSGTTFVTDTNITVAAFTVEPSSGIEPLQVNLNNNSNHATNYEWSINGEITFDENPTFDTAGFYNIQLIAYNNLPECADTAQFTLFVEPAFEVAVPNVFSPNNNGKNDAFIIDFSRVTSFTIAIYNRWGQQVHTLSKEIADLRKESIPIWDGKDAADGIYYYTLQVTNNYENYAYRRQPKFKELTGTVTVVR